MRDVVVVLMTFGFFALCVGYVVLCDRIVGADEPDGEGSAAPSGATAVASAAVLDRPDAAPALVATGRSNPGTTGSPEVTR